MLQKGDIGEWVKYIQDILSGLGLYKGKSHGEFDDATEQAVRTFQTTRGLAVSGTVDDDTMNTLEQALDTLQEKAPKETFMGWIKSNVGLIFLSLMILRMVKGKS